MIILFLICLVALLVVLQQNWADWSLDQLHYHLESDTTLVEPNQTFRLTSSLENRWFLPVLYIRLQENLPAELCVRESEEWAEEHVRVSSLGRKYLEDPFYLMPRRRRTSTLAVSLPQRGGYRLGEVTLTCGDFLGSRETTRHFQRPVDVVVIPKRCADAELLQVLGGFMGNISVRRFILEDPILTVGFREYTGREPMKAISWPQSARANRLLVKQYDYTVDATVTVLLNTEGGGNLQLERCFSLARTACEELEKKGIPYDFRTNGDLVGPLGAMHRVNEGLGAQHLNTILYGLARAGYHCSSTLEKLVEQTLRSARPNQSYILITPPLTPAKQRPLELLRAVSDGQVCILTGQEVVS